MTREVESALFPAGKPKRKQDLNMTFELYKIMVKSSEDLVARRQGVNTFFVSVNGALLTAIGLLVGSDVDEIYTAVGVALLGGTGLTLALSWRSRIKSFGQLNTGKFAVISKLEEELPAAIFSAEWIALGEGKDPKRYRTFTSRELWAPWTFFAAYVAVLLFASSYALWLFCSRLSI